MPSKFFVCNQCLRQAPRRSPSSILNIIRSRGYADAKPLESLAAQNASALASEAQGQASKAFPKKTTSKAVAIWLLGSAASCFGIVVFGGLTRLTESGLSITEWRPVTGSLPPMSAADWESEFEKYRASPEFKLLNPHMTLDEFKKIYFMEWTHRLWGRFIGLSFVLPSLYFVARRRVSPRMALNLLGISSLIGFQGFIGWWMVKSGLKDDLFAPGSHPRVSQYRLTTHLATAFVCYSWMLLSGLTILRTRRLLADPVAASAAIKAIRNPALNAFRRSVLGVTGLVFLTAMSGGLVAGLDAGLIYNEFPKMGLGLTPPKSELWDKFYARKEDGSDLWWRNMLENPSLKGTTGLVHLVSLQAALGISTLIYMVPIHLAATHQAGSLAVLTGALVLAHRLHVPKSTVRMIEQRLKQIKP
ncbi:cytochrome oxidase assembly [Trichoderma longibrachiatum ATCC 18648]|uniref:Cytochrome oxidase assembly n=1 Tax=Trichoderma longibrachiatum ATCC 18648 TaxID=983965 RepID=A0A2T4C8H9_TRILO|nr:cytochrome oxidase assembly [Trichoderma longibrachiatum ATCC 18648]